MITSKLCEADQIDKSQVYHLSRYLIEISLIEVRMLQYYPSQLAASAFSLSLKLLRVKNISKQNLAQITSYEKDALVKCANDLVILLVGI